MAAEGLEKISKVASAALGGQPAPDLVVVDDEADGILLVMGEVGGGGGQLAGEFKLAGEAGMPEAHRGGGVQHQVHPQAGFLLVLLDEIALAAPEQLPIEVAQVVALHVIAVVAEFHTGPFEHAGVAARPPALRGPARPEHQMIEPAHRLGA